MWEHLLYNNRICIYETIKELSCLSALPGFEWKKETQLFHNQIIIDPFTIFDWGTCGKERAKSWEKNMILKTHKNPKKKNTSDYSDYEQFEPLNLCNYSERKQTNKAKEFLPETLVPETIPVVIGKHGFERWENSKLSSPCEFPGLSGFWCQDKIQRYSLRKLSHKCKVFVWGLGKRNQACQ